MFRIRSFQSILRSVSYTKILTLLAALLLTAGFISIPTGHVQAISCSQFYTVQYGDDLNRIAARYGVSWQYLAGINGIYYTNTLQPGQTICVYSSDVPISPAYSTGAVTYPYYNNYPTTYYNQPTYYSYPYNNYRNNYPYNYYYNTSYTTPYYSSTSNCTQYYTVQYGDNLYRIAQAYGVSWNYLASINNTFNPNALYAGQSICVRTSGYYQGYNPYPYSSCRIRYTVQAGDNLYRIGLMYGYSWTYIASLNGIYNPNTLYVGQSLCITP